MKIRSVIVMAAIASLTSSSLATTKEFRVDEGESRTLTADDLVNIEQDYTSLTKTGPGRLIVGDVLKDYSGQIFIEEGVFEATSGNAFGTALGETFVFDGGTLAINSPASYSFNNQTETIHLSGRGSTTYAGALANLGRAVQYLCATLRLEDDATYYAVSGAGECGICWASMYFEGYTFTIGCATSYERFNLNRVDVKTAGTIDIAKGYLQIVGNSGYAWAGSSANRVYVRRNTGRLLLQASKATIPWSLEVEDGAYFVANDVGGFQNPEYNRWDGPIAFTDGTVAGTAAGAGYSLYLGGALSGSGDYQWSASWLYLDNDSSELTGGLKFTGAKAGGLGIVKAGAIGPASKGIDISGGDLALTAAEGYDLPPLRLDGADGGGAYSVSGGAGTLASLHKSGAAVHLFNARLAVTGLVELAGGVLRLPSLAGVYGNPGLHIGWTDASSPGSEWWTRNTYTNRTTLSLEHAYAPYTATDKDWYATGRVATYSGYIWNRTGTNETWTIVGNMETGVQMHISPTWSNPWLNNTSGQTNRVTVTPGPHFFEVRLYRGTPYPPRYRTSAGSDWPKEFGIAFCRSGRTDLTPADFQKFEDPGDGSLFTLDLDGRRSIDASRMRASFRELKLSGGALDLNDREINFPVAELSGFGRIANGVVTVTNALKVTTAAIAGGGIVFDNCDLAFGPDAEVSAEPAGAVIGHGSAGRLIARVTGGGTVTGLPARTADGRYVLRLLDNGEIRVFGDRALSIMLR